jgi:outer membrane lipoprotein
MMRGFLVITIFVACLSGCAHVVSRDVLEEVNRDITFAELRKNPEAYKGKVVMLGGVIVKTLNKKVGTLPGNLSDRDGKRGYAHTPGRIGRAFLGALRGFFG